MQFDQGTGTVKCAAFDARNAPLLPASLETEKSSDNATTAPSLFLVHQNGWAVL